MTSNKSEARPHPARADMTDSLGMEFVKVPAGDFLMGNHDSPAELARAFPQYEPRRIAELEDEVPVHRVRITKAFHLGQCQVTLGRFQQFVSATGFQTESERDGTGGWGYDPAYSSPESGSFRGRDPQYSCAIRASLKATITPW